MKRILLILLIGCVGAVQAQLDKVHWAQEYTDTYQFARAYELWSTIAEEADSASDQRIHAIRQAATTAFKAGMSAEALRWSRALVLEDAILMADVERHVRLLRINGHADQIPQLLQGGAVDSLPAEEVRTIISREQRIDRMVRDSIAYEVRRYRPNAKGNEFAAVPYGGGLVFQSTAVDPGVTPMKDGWSGAYFTELMFVPDTAEPEPRFGWKQLLNDEDLFSEFGHARTHDGPVAFDAEQDFAVLTRNQTELDSLSQVRLSHLRLEFYWKRPWGWELARPFPWNSSQYSCGHGTFDAAGDVIFMSDMPGGYGGMDLYRTRWEDGDWSKPENMGSAVNTSGNESFPFVSPSGFLYFASDGHPGIGGMDVFVHPLGSKHVERLGSPINSTADDFGLVLDEPQGKGWLSSNREKQTDALYQVFGKPLIGVLEIEVKSCDGASLEGASISFVDQQTGAKQSWMTDALGMASAYGWLGRTYEVSVEPVPGMDAPPPTLVEVSEQRSNLLLEMNYTSKQNSLVVLDEEQNPAEGVLLTFEDAAGTSVSFVTDSDGRYEWSAASQPEDYVRVKTVLINYNDLVHEFIQSPPGCLLSISDTLVLEPWTVDEERIDLANILYDLGSAELREASKRELDKLVSYMIDRPLIRVELSSHTDCRNDEAHNQNLSQARANSCVRYIIGKGIAADRILAKGYGESQLLNDCSDASTCGCAPLNVIGCVPCSEELHQQNRRTELRLLAD